jgi:hypothetical protein
VSTNQHPPASAGMALGASGIGCLVMSLMIYSQRQFFAALLFGAHFLFGIPLTGDDSLKLLFVGLGSLVGVVSGFVLVIAGVIVFARAPRLASGSEGVVDLPTAR